MANITGTGVPTEYIEGVVGDIYTDTVSGKEYKCVSVINIRTDDGTTSYYSWVLIQKNSEITGGLPEVTAEDSGKILRVSETGEWVAEDEDVIVQFIEDYIDEALGGVY